MLFGVISTAAFTAQWAIAVAPRQSYIGGPNDLPGHIVATQAESSAHAYLQRRGIAVNTPKTQECKEEIDLWFE